MVLLSIEPLNASGTEGLNPCSRLLTWAVAAIDLVYSALAVDVYIYLFRFLIYSISSFTLGFSAEAPKAWDMVLLNLTRLKV